MNDRPMTFGERAVGLSFNPSGNPAVNELKTLCAALIDACQEAREETSDPEVKRMYSIAITEAQTAQMWSVKAATWRRLTAQEHVVPGRDAIAEIVERLRLRLRQSENLARQPLAIEIVLRHLLIGLGLLILRVLHGVPLLLGLRAQDLWRQFGEPVRSPALSHPSPVVALACQLIDLRLELEYMAPPTISFADVIWVETLSAALAADE